MTKKTRRHAFTIVELVIVIAVVAILAAVLIPTYANLVKKANEATALADAKNLVTEMLADILSGDKDAADIVVFSKKGGAIYVHAYSAGEGRILQFTGNPIVEKASDNFEADVNSAIEKLTAGRYITPENVGADSWRTDASLASILKDIGMDANETRMFARFKVEKSFSEKEPVVTPECQHTHTEKEADIEATCTEPGYKGATVCKDCGKVLEARTKNADALGHDLKEVGEKAATCTETGFTGGKRCSRCGYAVEGTVIPALTHAWDNGTVTTEATCAKAGVKTYKCTREGCNGTKTEEIAKLTTHTWDAGKVTKPATETEEGVMTYTCEVCKTTKTSSIPKASHVHNYGNWKVTKAATCKSTGEVTGTCSCGASFTKPGDAVNPNNHEKTVVDPAVAATCVTAGKTEGSHCEACKKVITAQTEIPATGNHTWGADGKCTVCKKEQTVEDAITAANAKLAAYGKTPKTMHEVMTEAGVSINAKFYDQVVWDSVNNKFCAVADVASNEGNCWQITAATTANTWSSKFCIYLVGDEDGNVKNSSGSVVSTISALRTSIDVGDTKSITSITINANTGDSRKRSLVVRTNGNETITINQATQVTHYGNAGKVTISSSYATNVKYIEEGKVSGLIAISRKSATTCEIEIKSEGKAARAIVAVNYGSSYTITGNGKTPICYTSSRPTIKNAGTGNDIGKVYYNGLTKFNEGFGTSSNPFVINSPADFSNMSGCSTTDTLYFKLGSDINISSSVSSLAISANSVLDLNGKTITIPDGGTIQVGSKGLTIKGNGQIVYTGNSGDRGIFSFFANGATITLEGGTYSGTYLVGVNAGNNDLTGTVTIKSGATVKVTKDTSDAVTNATIVRN